MTLITRSQYMENSSELHEKYYGQFVNRQILNLVENAFGFELLQKSLKKDKNLNNIELRLWDNLSSSVNHLSTNSRKMAEEGNSISTGVCIAKAAARMIVNEYE